MVSPPRRTRSIVAWGVVGACAVATLWNLAPQLRHARSDIEIGTTRPRAYRADQPARTVGLPDPRVFHAAEALIPSGARYVIVTGPGTGVSDPQVLRWVKPFARYLLVPRRLISDRRKAEWVFSYGGDLTRLGLRYEKVVPIGRGLSIAKIEDRR